MNASEKIKVGTLLTYSPPSNLFHHYYQVVEITGKFCVIRQIESQTTNGGWNYYSKPKPNAFKENDITHNALYPPMRRLIKTIRGEDYVKLSRTECAWIWDGEPQWNSHLD